MAGWTACLEDGLGEANSESVGGRPPDHLKCADTKKKALADAGASSSSMISVVLVNAPPRNAGSFFATGIATGPRSISANKTGLEGGQGFEKPN